MHRHAPLFIALLTLLAACGNPAPSPTPRTPTPGPTPTPIPTPPPDTLTVQVKGVGIGAYDLVAVPVAILHNAAARHGAAMVVVHFTTSGPSGTHSLDSIPVNLAPGETLPVTADCTDACTGANNAAATLTVGTWVPTSGATLRSSGVGYQCNGCGSHAHGDVTGTLEATLGNGAAVEAFASCSTASGAIVGGGSQELVWPGTPTHAVDVPVIVSAQPQTCMLGASTGW
ncbi:MAG: hypothetical protein JOY68_03680 [Candidatus Dormibacteraeota bacterium]|nr:hypothetical protein [Candidatus Dormibacteraeota bacterium]MBV8445724.1 hypothetical protein [Candidatus Dormibacteraeota bacterium]